MAQWASVLATKTNDLSSLPQDLHGEKKRADSCKLSPDLHAHTVTHKHMCERMCMHTRIPEHRWACMHARARTHTLNKV